MPTFEGFLSEADLSDALVAKWEQISAARFLNLVKSWPRRVEAVIAADQ